MNRHEKLWCFCGTNFCALADGANNHAMDRAAARILQHTRSMARHVISTTRKAAANPYLIKVVRKREGRRPAAAYGSPVVNDASIIGSA